MQLTARQGLKGQCCGRGETREVDLWLVGEQAPGTWLYVFLDTAREVLDTDSARQIDQALDAVESALRGEAIDDALFADLTGREPQLPEHLRGQQ